jgi:hypothetical protein
MRPETTTRRLWRIKTTKVKSNKVTAKIHIVDWRRQSCRHYPSNKKKTNKKGNEETADTAAVHLTQCSIRVARHMTDPPLEAGSVPDCPSTPSHHHCLQAQPYAFPQPFFSLPVEAQE